MQINIHYNNYNKREHETAQHSMEDEINSTTANLQLCDLRPYSKSIITLTLNEWRLSLSKCNSALNEYSFTLNEWEATLALGPFTNGTHSRNRG